MVSWFKKWFRRLFGKLKDDEELRDALREGAKDFFSEEDRGKVIRNLGREVAEEALPHVVDSVKEAVDHGAEKVSEELSEGEKQG